MLLRLKNQPQFPTKHWIPTNSTNKIQNCPDSIQTKPPQIKIPQSQPNKNPQNQNIIFQIIQRIKQKQWKQLSQKFFILINMQQNPKQILKIAIQLYNAWLVNPNLINLLEYFDYIMMETLEQTTKQMYNHFMLNITERVIQFTMQSRSEQKIVAIDNKTEIPDNKDKQITCVWQVYLELLRSYTYQCLQYSLNDKNWTIFHTIFSLTLPNCEITPLTQQTSSQKLQYKLQKLVNTKYFINNLLKQLFHCIALMSRVYISDLQTFISTNNKLITINNNYPNTNNCTLVLKLIEYIFTNTQNISNNQQKQKQKQKQDGIKLDCLMLLMTIIEGNFKICQNYNQILQFAIRIILFIQSQSQQSSTYPKQKQHSNPHVSQLQLYSAQLISIILYRNHEWLIKFTRRQHNKPLIKLLKIYKNTLMFISKTIYKLEYQNIVYKRLILGFCGMLRIQTMQTILQQCIIQINSYVIRMIQAQYGWHEEQNDQYQPTQQSQSISNHNNNQQVCKERQGKYMEWNEQYYNKHKVIAFQEIQQVDAFLQSVWVIKNNGNQTIFQTIMNNFDQKQAVVWIAQLQRFQNQKNNGQYDDQ